MRDSVATEVSATFVFINNSVRTPVALYIFQQPQTWKIFTLGLQSFSVAAGQTGSCERPDFRVNPAHSAPPSVISANRPADCSADFIWLIAKAPYLTSCDSTWQIATGPSHMQTFMLMFSVDFILRQVGFLSAGELESSDKLIVYAITRKYILPLLPVEGQSICLGADIKRFALLTAETGTLFSDLGVIFKMKNQT